MLSMIENAVGEGFRTLGIGIMIVIGVLVLLMAVLYLLIPLFSKIANKKPKEKKSNKAEAPSLIAETATPAPAPVEEDDGDVVAAIIAAIASESGRTPSSLRVVSFKRIK